MRAAHMWEQELFVWAFWDAINRWVRRSWRSAVPGTGDPQISNFHQSNMLHPLRRLESNRTFRRIAC